MKIGIDFRIDESGIGRYTEELIAHLAKIDTKNEYSVFVRADRFRSWEPPGKNFHKVSADIAWYSFAEQRRLPAILQAAQLDLMHFPHFNAPLRYRLPFVVTIHDLTHTKHSTAEASTRGSLFFSVKKLAYDRVMKHAAKDSRAIIAISKHDKKDIEEILGAEPAKISVIYEGFDPQIFAKVDDSVLKNHAVVEPFWLAVGNFYPHKNLVRLVEAFAAAKQKGLDGQLVLAGDYAGFDGPIRAAAATNHVQDDVILTGRVSDAQLGALYQKARGLAFVSLAEGFGLPALEAFANNLPVLSSQASALPEILGDGALLVDPENIGAIADGLLKLANDQKLRADLIKNGSVQLKKYSWEQAARQTLDLYQKSAH